MANVPRKDSLRCNSLSGELLEIAYESFVRQVKRYDESWLQLESQDLRRRNARDGLISCMATFQDPVNAQPKKKRGKSTGPVPTCCLRKSYLGETIQPVQKKTKDQEKLEQDRLLSSLGLGDEHAYNRTLVGFSRELTPILKQIQLDEQRKRRNNARLLKNKAEGVRHYRPGGTTARTSEKSPLAKTIPAKPVGERSKSVLPPNAFRRCRTFRG